MTIEEMRKSNGETAYNGKEYILTVPAYIAGTISDPYYTASAICPDDQTDEHGLYPVYIITWCPTQEWLDGDQDDEGWACNWGKADEVEETCMLYDLEKGRII